HHRRPDVIEKLDLDYGLHASRRHADRSSDNTGFSERGVEAALRTEGDLQSLRRLEYTTFALHLAEIGFPARVRDILTEDHDSLVAAHLFVQREVDRIDHRARIAGKTRLDVELFRSGIDTIGIKVS